MLPRDMQVTNSNRKTGIMTSKESQPRLRGSTQSDETNSEPLCETLKSDSANYRSDSMESPFRFQRFAATVLGRWLNNVSRGRSDACNRKS